MLTDNSNIISIKIHSIEEDAYHFQSFQESWMTPGYIMIAIATAIKVLLFLYILCTEKALEALALVSS